MKRFRESSQNDVTLLFFVPLVLMTSFVDCPVGRNEIKTKQKKLDTVRLKLIGYLPFSFNIV